MRGYQVTLEDLVESQGRRGWVPPAGRQLLRLRELDATVRPIYDPGTDRGARLEARRTTLEFLSRHHYLQRVPGAKDPAMTWSFGLYLNGELAGVVVLNPPAAGVCQWLYGDRMDWRARVIAATRTCCVDAAPFNSESFMVAAVWRLLPRLDHRFSVGVAMSDLAVVDPEGKVHSGAVYRGAGAWWAGRSEPGTWRGFINPVTGARISRKCGGRTRTRDECPPGWLVEPGAVLNRFLWFVGPLEAEARAALEPRVQVLARPGAAPVWLRPRDVRRGTPRAYPAVDRVLRQRSSACSNHPRLLFVCSHIDK